MEIKRYSGNGLPSVTGGYVLYADHASEVSRLEEQLDVMATKLDTAQNLKVYVEDYANKVEADLRAQLEAAKELVPLVKTWLDDENRTYAESVARSNRLRAHLGMPMHASRLTAQPDGVREADMGGLNKAWVQGYDSAHHDRDRPHMPPTRNPYPLTAPAPACKTCGGSKVIYTDPHSREVCGPVVPCPDCNAGEGNRG